MANTQAQLQAERWVVTEYLPKLFNKQFKGKSVSLIWGGGFNFDAVSEDGEIIACISTSSIKTAGGKPSTGAFNKIRGDALFLLHGNSAKRRCLIFTEKDMYNHYLKEIASGRFPPGIELIFVDLPADIKQKVKEAKKAASQEVSR
jgi:hypothetical protein